MSETVTCTDVAVVEPPPVRYIHTRWPSPASMAANGAVAALALLAGGTLAAGSTGHLEVESPITAVLIVLMYALGAGAWVAREHAEVDGAPKELL